MMMEFGGSASFDVFCVLEVPDGTDPEEFVMDPANKKLIWSAMQEYWDNTGIKFRDAEVLVTDGGEVGEESRDEFTEIYEL